MKVYVEMIVWIVVIIDIIYSELEEWIHGCEHINGWRGG